MRIPQMAATGNLRDELWDLLLVSTENHEAAVLSPSWVAVLMLVASDKDDTERNLVLNFSRLCSLLTIRCSLPVGNWLHAFLQCLLGKIIQAHDDRLRDTIHPSKAKIDQALAGAQIY